MATKYALCLETADPDLLPQLADLIDNASTFRLEEMTIEQLKELAHTVAAVKSMIQRRKPF